MLHALRPLSWSLPPNAWYGDARECKQFRSIINFFARVVLCAFGPFSTGFCSSAQCIVRIMSSCPAQASVHKDQVALWFKHLEPRNGQMFRSP